MSIKVIEDIVENLTNCEITKLTITIYKKEVQEYCNLSEDYIKKTITLPSEFDQVIMNMT